MTTTRPMYSEIAFLLQAIANCEKHSNTVWLEKHTDRLEELTTRLPSGSGFDNGTTLDRDKSTPSRLVFVTSFHHMDDYGGYSGWTDHTVIITPSFIGGFDIRVTGQDRGGIKEYIADTFHTVLTEEVAS